MARGGSLLWWVTAVISHRMITGSPLTVYNCWRPRESLSTNKPRGKRQHADEESTTGVKVFRAQSRLTKKPVQSATTCLTRCISGAEVEVTPVITVWLADRHQREAETEPHHNLLRGSRAGRSRRSQRASWRNIPAKSASVVVPPGWESQRDLLKVTSCQKKWEEYCADTEFTQTPVCGYDFAIYSVKCEGTNAGRNEGRNAEILFLKKSAIQNEEFSPWD